MNLLKSSGIFFLLTGFLLPLLTTIQSAALEAYPVQIAQAQKPELDKFFNYLNEQKFTFLLGVARSGCSYEIDPTDVYKQGNSHFVLAKVSRGVNGGTACRGVLDFTILQADCQTNKLYQFVRESQGDPRFRGWQRFEMSLYTPDKKSISVITQQVCALTAK